MQIKLALFVIFLSKCILLVELAPLLKKENEPVYNVHAILGKIDSNLKQLIVDTYSSKHLNPSKVPASNLTAITLENLNLFYQEEISKIASDLILEPDIPLEKADALFALIPSEKLTEPISQLPTNQDPWTFLPGKFLILNNLVRAAHRPVARWDKQLMTHYRIYLDGLSQKQLDSIEYELPTNFIDHAAKELMVLDGKFSRKDSCYTLIRNMNENLRKLSDVSLSEDATKFLLSCVSVSDLLLKDDSLMYSTFVNLKVSPIDEVTGKVLLNKLLLYISATKKSVPEKLVPYLDAHMSQVLITVNQVDFAFVRDVVATSKDFGVLAKVENILNKHDQSDWKKLLMFSPYLHISKITDFQTDISILCRDIESLLPESLSLGQRRAFFDLYKKYCHAGQTIDYKALDKSKVSLCYFHPGDLNSFKLEDLRNMHDKIEDACPCLTSLQKFAIFSKIEEELQKRESFHDLLSCFENFISEDLAKQLILQQVSNETFCSSRPAQELLGVKIVSDAYLGLFNWNLCSDTEKLQHLRNLKFFDSEKFMPQNNEYFLEYLHLVGPLVEQRSIQMKLANKFVNLEKSKGKTSLSELQGLAMSGKTLIELPVDFVTTSRFCLEAIQAIADEDLEGYPASTLQRWSQAYFSCQENKLVLATRKDLDGLGNLLCHISPHWVRTMTVYTFKVFISRISSCKISLELGEAILEVTTKLTIYSNDKDDLILSSIAPLYCFIDPLLGASDQLLPNELAAIAVKGSTLSGSAFFEWSREDKEKVENCGRLLGERALNRSSDFSSLSCGSSRDAEAEYSCWHLLMFHQHGASRILPKMSQCELERCLRNLGRALPWDSSEALDKLSLFISSGQSASTNSQLERILDSGKALESLSLRDFQNLIPHQLLTNIEFIHFLINLDISQDFLYLVQTNLNNLPKEEQNEAFHQFTSQKLSETIDVTGTVNHCISLEQKLQRQTLSSEDLAAFADETQCASEDFWAVVSSIPQKTSLQVLQSIYGSHGIPRIMYRKAGLYHLMENSTTTFPDAPGPDEDRGGQPDGEQEDPLVISPYRTQIIYIYAASGLLASNFLLINLSFAILFYFY